MPTDNNISACKYKIWNRPVAPRTWFITYSLFRYSIHGHGLDDLLMQLIVSDRYIRETAIYKRTSVSFNVYLLGGRRGSWDVVTPVNWTRNDVCLLIELELTKNNFDRQIVSIQSIWRQNQSIYSQSQLNILTPKQDQQTGQCTLYSRTISGYFRDQCLHLRFFTGKNVHVQLKNIHHIYKQTHTPDSRLTTTTNICNDARVFDDLYLSFRIRKKNVSTFIINPQLPLPLPFTMTTNFFDSLFYLFYPVDIYLIITYIV